MPKLDEKMVDESYNSSQIRNNGNYQITNLTE